MSCTMRSHVMLLFSSRHCCLLSLGADSRCKVCLLCSRHIKLFTIKWLFKVAMVALVSWLFYYACAVGMMALPKLC